MGGCKGGFPRRVPGRGCLRSSGASAPTSEFLRNTRAYDGGGQGRTSRANVVVALTAEVRVLGRCHGVCAGRRGLACCNGSCIFLCGFWPRPAEAGSGVLGAAARRAAGRKCAGAEGSSWGRERGAAPVAHGPRTQTATREPPRPGACARDVYSLFIIFEAPTRRSRRAWATHKVITRARCALHDSTAGTRETGTAKFA